MFTVGKSCASERLKCGCKPDKYQRQRDNNGIGWIGCDDGVNFGYKKSKDFIGVEGAEDLTTKINLHNNEAGRLAVKKHMRVGCKCHGGWNTACTIKTCWKTMPSFRDVGTRLLEKFERAERVRMTKDGNLLARWNKKPPPKESLVYDKQSHSFCEPKKKFGSFGTHGRQCNVTDLGIYGCDLMCCGRGYTIMEETNSGNCDNCTDVQDIMRCI